MKVSVGHLPIAFVIPIKFHASGFGTLEILELNLSDSGVDTQTHRQEDTHKRETHSIQA